MPRLSLILMAAVLAANLPARAQHMNEKDSPCADAVVTLDLVNCLARARDAADAQLNAVYKRVFAGNSTPPTDSVLLQPNGYGFSTGTRTAWLNAICTTAERRRLPRTWPVWRR